MHGPFWSLFHRRAAAVPAVPVPLSAPGRCRVGHPVDCLALSIQCIAV